MILVSKILFLPIILAKNIYFKYYIAFCKMGISPELGKILV